MNAPGLSASSMSRSKGSTPRRGFRFIHRSLVPTVAMLEPRSRRPALRQFTPMRFGTAIEQAGYNHPDEAKVRPMAGKDAKSKPDRKVRAPMCSKDLAIRKPPRSSGSSGPPQRTPLRGRSNRHGHVDRNL